VRRYALAREEEFERIVNQDVEARICEGVKAVLEEVLEEEMNLSTLGRLPGAHAHPPRRAQRLENRRRVAGQEVLSSWAERRQP
jgi:hypothetical protein